MGDMVEVTTSCEIEAAHRLPDYQGKCNRLHGHNWRIEVSVSGEINERTGMLIDFKELRSVIEQVVGPYDHRVLNDVEPFDRAVPTAENMAVYFSQVIRCKLSVVRSVSVVVYENDRSFARAVCL